MVLRLLREPRWVGGLVLALAMASACVLLGRWQLNRRAETLRAIAPVTLNYHLSPRPLADVLPSTTGALPRARDWTPVQVTGRYDAAATRLVRNRPSDAGPGFEVVVPFRTDSGLGLLVDRGWLPTGSGGGVPDAVPAPPTGDVRLVARLRPAESASPQLAPPGQLQRITPAAFHLGYPLLNAYAVLATETPAPRAAPRQLPEPSVDEGPHLSYAVQWFGFALAAFGIWTVLGRRELERRAELAGSESDRSSSRSVPPTAPLEPSRRRRTDEEIEDEQIEAARRG